MNNYRLFTSEFVGNGHPDKLCDFISDAILDYCLSNDINSRVAVETMAKDENIVLGGEVTTQADLSDEVIARIVTDVLKEVGYSYTPVITNLLNSQSPDIALGTNDDVGGAGDQGIMFGYACNDTEEFMPMSYVLARKIIREIETNETTKNLGPDMKSQVTLEDCNGTYVARKVLVSVQHPDDMDLTEVKMLIRPIILKVLDDNFIIYDEGDTDTKLILINPTGRFVIGGPIGDAGVTGRKIIVDTYGGAGHHGGGAFSGKDPSKVDRSAAYMLRHIAKTIVSSKICNECEIQISYAIGLKQPLSVSVKTDNMIGEHFDNELVELIRKHYDLSPAGIKSYLGLLSLKYKDIGMSNIFGDSTKSVHRPWEDIDIEFADIIVDKYLSLINRCLKYGED